MADETTRLLCAAAHRYDWFSEAVIREYLVEQVGTVPPSPGLDTAAVLRDAVAARTRHRVRDALVLVLLVALAVLNPVAVVLWIVAALVGYRLLASRPRASDAGELFSWAGALALLLLVALVKAGAGIGFPSGDHTWWPSLAIGAAMYAVLVGDIWFVRTYLRRRFRSHSFVADHTRAESAVERRVRGLGLRRYAGQLERFAAADEHSAQAAGTADVVVHRGDTPFVGAGYVVPTQSVPIVLRPAVGRPEPPSAISVPELYGRIAAELVPPDAGRPREGRIAAVAHREQLLIPVVELMHERHTGFGSRVLRDLHEPPVRHLPVDEVRAVAAAQLEWARYYSCFRRESWKRNVVTSCYLQLTMQGRTLQVDVTHCVLPPVRSWLNEADEVLQSSDLPLVAGSVELLRLPLTVPRRLLASTRSLRPRRLWTRGIDANRYGTGGSLREGVSPRKEETHYFKRNDAFTQVKVMHNELFAIVVDYLEERGYDVSELGKRAATMIETHTMNINNSTFVNADITNGAVNPPQQPAATPTPTPTPA